MFVTFASSAGPWLPPGDAGLRHDIEVLADRGVLRGPVTTWPLPWADIARDVLQVDAGRDGLDAVAHASLLRVQSAARQVMRTGVSEPFASVAAASKPTALRTFSATPREDGEVSAGIDWTGERFAAHLQGTLVSSPDDGQDARADGSYVGVNVWNLMLSAGYMERWWGPGWEGSLILSNNARPIPSVTVERNFSDAFKTPWLRWVGPWRASVTLGQLEGDRTDYPDARFLGMRVSFKPLKQLEIGLSRTAQWCGEGRPCGLGTLGDLLAGRDNDQTLAQQPGNQLAGYDVRWAFRSVPVALYGQLIGEDEAGALPAKFLGLAGAEVWGDSALGQWRAHLEYADTACNFSRKNPTFNCAYESGIYTQGYRFHDRSIGHAMDGDGRMMSAGLMLIDSKARSWELTVRRVELNRDANTSPEFNNAEIAHQRKLGRGVLRAGAGFDDGENSVTRGFAQWTFGF